MTSYRRNFIAGGSFFFTANLANRRLNLLTDHIEELRAAFRQTRLRHPFTIDAMVVLPDHLHAIWTLPNGDADFAGRWRLIKSAFSRNLPKGEAISHSRPAKGERGIWQRRFWEHTIRDEDDFARHFDYIHINPVKHRLSRECRIGHIRHFIARSNEESIRRIGPETRLALRGTLESVLS